MSLIVGENTYADLSTVQAYFDSMEYDETATNGAVLRAMKYIESQNYKGIPATADQDLKWPRRYVVFDGYTLSETEVPTRLVKALCEAAYIETKIPGKLTPLFHERDVRREKIDVIEIEYEPTYHDKFIKDKNEFPALEFLLNGLVIPKGAASNIKMELM